MTEIRRLQNDGQIEESIVLLEELIDSGERGGEALYRYGRALSLRGKGGRAIWALDAALEDPEWFVRASHQLALNAHRASNFDLALQVLERLREERLDSHDEDLPARLLEARVLLYSRRFYEEALEHIELILDDHPEHEEATRLKAVALLGMKEPDEAYELIREAGILMGDLETEEGTEDGAEDMIEQGEGEATAVLDLDLDGDTEAATLDTAAAERQELYWCIVRTTFKREAGEIKEAREIADDCLAKFPSSVELLNEALAVFTAQADYDRVLEALQTANEEDPENRNIRNTLVSHFSAIGLPEEGEALLRKALEDARASEPAKPIYTASILVDLAGRLLERGDINEGVEAFDEAIELLGDQASQELRFRFADALILAKRYDDAVEIANAAQVEVHGPMIRGRVAFERNDYETALAELDRVALIWPDNAPTRYYLARASEGLGDFDRAVEEYRQAMRSDPSLVAARERLIRLHLAEGKVREANSIHRFVSPKKKTSSTSLEMRLLAVEIQTRLGNEPNLSLPPEAEISLREIQKRTIHSLARGLRLRDGAAGASEVLGRLASVVQPVSKDIFVREQVELLLEDDDTVEEAIQVARQAIEEQPGRPLLSLALGRALVRSGTKLEEAETALQAALAANPDQADALASLGEIAALRGDNETALTRFEAALALDAGHWQAASNRFELLLRSDRREEAFSAIESYLDRDNPYDGRAALALALALASDDTARDHRTALARRAIRFGAGSEAVDLLTELDPEQAALLKTRTPAPPKAEESEQAS